MENINCSSLSNHPAILKNLHSDGLGYLHLLFNSVLKKRPTPLSLENSCISILKLNSDALNSCSYRPTPLTGMLEKVFEKVMKKIMWFLGVQLFFPQTIRLPPRKNYRQCHQQSLFINTRYIFI